MKSGYLNFLEPSGPLQACNGTNLPLLSGREIHQVPCRIRDAVRCPPASMVSIQFTFLRPPKFVEICGNFMGMVNMLHCNYECASVHWVQIAQHVIQHRAHSNEDAGPIKGLALLDRLCYHHLTKHLLRGLYNLFVTSNFHTAKFIIQHQKRSENYITGNSIVYRISA